MEVFDLHSHPVVKTLFKEQYHAISAWKPLKILKNLVNALDSQCALDQICDAKMNLICFTRNAVERGMVDQSLLRFASIFIKALEKSRLNKMATGIVNYDQQLGEELTNLLKCPDGKYPKQEVVFLKTLSDYKKNDKGTLYQVFNVEGGHIFNDLGKDCEDVDIECIRVILQKLRCECPMIFYFTPAHLTPNNLINHAYGNKILYKKPFIPDAFGICSTGWKVIEELYKRNILIDIKHMSLISRLQFYDRHKKDFADKPVIASHVGFTGLSLENLKDTVTPIRKGNDFIKIEQPATDGIIQMKNLRSFSSSNSSLTAFNSNSINLYDEDIEYILKSGGLIGLIFDVRILGSAIKDTVTEFISKKEYEEWQELFHVPVHKTVLKANIYRENKDRVYYKKEDFVERKEELDLYFPVKNPGNFSQKQNEIKEEEHLLHFINHLLYLIVVCTNRKLSINPWKQVCIGTDYDGLIAPMHCCKDATFFESFAKKLKTRIPEEAAKAKITMPTAIDTFINDLFFDNAYRLLCDHFK